MACMHLKFLKLCSTVQSSCSFFLPTSSEEFQTVFNLANIGLLIRKGRSSAALQFNFLLPWLCLLMSLLLAAIYYSLMNFLFSSLSYELFVVLFLSHKSHFYMLDTYSLPNKTFCKYPLPVQGLSFSFC